jgi:hypothetical protein
MERSDKKFKLEELPKHNIYQVPEGYFDRLPMRVMERTAGAEKAGSTWQPVLWRNLRLAIAPMILLLVFAGVYYFSADQPVPSTPANYALGSLAEQEIVDYLTYSTELETADFAGINVISKQDLTAEYLNVSAATAEEELEYYHIKNLDY